MTKIHHINCGWLHAPPNPKACCHCLLLQDANGLALVDTGIGTGDVHDPVGRLGQTLIDRAGFQFNEADTAARQIEALGFKPSDVKHIVLSHGDPDHAGGLGDFPNATVHISPEERDAVEKGHWRYLPVHFAHGPKWNTRPKSTRDWFGIEARILDLGFESEILQIPLFGHTMGQCGNAIQQGGKWVLHVADAYYLRIELDTDDSPVAPLVKARAMDDAMRIASLAHLRRLHRDHADEIEMFGYHDTRELP